MIPSATGNLDARVEVLIRRWNLPPERGADVARLIEAEASGETAASVLESDPAAWGPAACTTGTSKVPAPLVLCRDGNQSWIQSWSCHEAEHAIARKLLELARETSSRASDTLLKLLDGDRLNDEQRRAITCALDHRLAIITGGPGTGKTHTLARLLALELAARPEVPCIALAAPTGKAAERMREAIERAAARLPPSLAHQAPGLREMALHTSTLHRLLGFNPATGRCGRNASRPLECSLLIIDEASMVDTLLWRAMLEALPAGAKVVLLGDPNQLESVAPGAVLASLVNSLHGDPLSPLRAVHVELTESHRFRDRPHIGALSQAIISANSLAAIEVLRTNRWDTPDAGSGGVSWLGDHFGRFDWSVLPASVQASLLAVAGAATPSEALAALAKIRLLTAHREGPMGASGLNFAVSLQVQRLRGGKASAEPILIVRNDPETGLKNGSVGVILEWQGVRTAFFPSQDEGREPLSFPIARLPEHVGAWAMTIHRSQGSEFDEVMVVLPESASPLATRELVYTGVTRARHTVHVWGSETTLAAAVSDPARRTTLLGLALRKECSRPTRAFPAK